MAVTIAAKGEVQRIDRAALPQFFSTHLHSAEFWEQLGRTIATYGFLEQTLGKAIYSLTATRQIEESEIEEAYLKWLPIIERALSDPLGPLIKSYAKALRELGEVALINPEHLISALEAAAPLRNVLCHGSWAAPDSEGKSLPLFVNKKLHVFSTPIDVAYLKQVQAHLLELVCDVIDSVTHMGWRFPGTLGLGTSLIASKGGVSDRAR